MVVHGDGPARAQIEGSCPSSVRFTGMTLDIDDIYADIDVLLIVSPDEVGPTTAIEAAVRGIPVVSMYPLPGVLEALGELALIPPQPDADSCVALITTAARSSTDRPSARALHERTTQHCDRAVVAARFISELQIPAPGR